ncbi:MAG: ABC transporter permease [Geminicoccaceae bacterium]|nr:ABC transporter permease [Geminicoccaceae bacterium]
MATVTAPDPAGTVSRRRGGFVRSIRALAARPGFLPGFVLFSVPLLAIILGALFLERAPMDNAIRLAPPSLAHPFGADNLGRDLFGHVLRGGQISLVIGICVAVLSTSIGLVLGLIAGFVRVADAILMRIMDGLMAIPGILLAIALMSVAGSGLFNVIVAITVADVPRVVRLVRSMVLSLREQTFVDAARMAGNGTGRIVFRHLLPATLGPLAVQATFICTSAIITEAYLSFIGAGTPPDTPSWGNIIAEGRIYFRSAPWIVLIPGFLIAATVLGINLMGDALRDALDPKVAKAI